MKTITFGAALLVLAVAAPARPQEPAPRHEEEESERPKRMIRVLQSPYDLASFYSSRPGQSSVTPPVPDDPAYALAHYHLGQSLTRLGRYQKAYESFEKVLEIEPDNAQALRTFDDALYQLASLDIRMGAHERAARLLSELIAENPNHEHAYYAYGQALLHLGREAEAQQALEAHMRLLQTQKPDAPVAVPE